MPSRARVYLLHKDQRRIAVDLHVTPLLDEKGRTIGAVEIFRDASSAVALEKAYAIMRETAPKDHLTGIANRRQVEDSQSEQLQGRKLTASFGIAEANLEDTRQTLLERADKALYRAKATGKNRVESA